MKKIIFLLLPALFLLMAFTLTNDKLTGHWVTVSPNPANVDFTSDGNFKVSVNGNTGNEGKYKLNNDVFSLFDENCGMKVEGKYKLTFFTPDSVSFTIISDSCAERAKDVNGGVIKRVK